MSETVETTEANPEAGEASTVDVEGGESIVEEVEAPEVGWGVYRK